MENWNLKEGGELSGNEKKENVVYLSDEALATWKSYLEEQDRLRKFEEEKNETLARIKSDPNYENYKAEIDSSFPEDSREFQSLFLLHKHLAETPKEELDKEFSEIEAMGMGGPTVEEYFEGINPAFQYQKGYSEGAKKLMERVIEHLSQDERPLIPSAEIIALMRSIYQNE